MGQNKSKLAVYRSKAFQMTGSSSTRWEKYGVNSLISTDEYENVTPLWLAVRYGDCDLAANLITFGAHVNTGCGGLRMTPLHMAAYNHNVSMVQLLLENGAWPNVLDSWNYTPLMYVAIHYEPSGVNELFHILLNHGAEVNFGVGLSNIGDHNRNHPKTRDQDSFESNHEDPYITYVREPMGPTSGVALHHAMQNPHLPNESLEILLNSGADVDIPNLHGQSPLMGAILDIYYDYHSNVKLHAELLIERFANVNAVDIRGWNSLHYAAKRGSITCMELLINAGADCDALSHKGESPLWILLAFGWREGIKYILQSGCDVNLPMLSTTILDINQDADICRYGYIRPIEFALCNKFYSFAQIMVKVGCKINNETWLGTLHDPLQAEQFLQFVRDQTKLRSLREICRKCIRKAIHRGICVKINRLYLPKLLKDYIMFSDIVS